MPPTLDDIDKKGIFEIALSRPFLAGFIVFILAVFLLARMYMKNPVANP